MEIKMGFGLTFIGYFFLIFFPLSRIGVLPNIALIGCIVIFLGLKRLTHYCSDNRAFFAAKILTALLAAASIAALMLDVADIDGAIDSMSTALVPVTNALYALVITAFTVALFVGVYKLSNDIELPKLAKRSVLMLSVNIAYLLAEISSSVCSLIRAYGDIASESFTLITGYLGVIAFIFAYVILFLNLSLIFSCYAHICLEGDEDMPYETDMLDKIVAWTKRNKK